MKLNPITQSLFANDGRLLKKLHCPKGMDWDAMHTSGEDARARICAACDHPVIDTAQVSEEELVKRLEQAPNTCVKVHLDQPNIIVTNATRS